MATLRRKSPTISISRKLPVVFVGCPYDEKTFRFSAFKAELDRLPWTCVFANTTLHTRHLLQKIKDSISKADFSFFDLSTWNPNVALELGLADGMKPASYYILTNGGLTNDVPSDIKGLQRIQYESLAKGQASLRSQLIEHFFKERFYPTRKLWRTMLDYDRSANRRFIYALQILARLRDREIVSLKNCKSLAQPFRLSEAEWLEICDAMRHNTLLTKVRAGGGFRLCDRNVFKRL